MIELKLSQGAKPGHGGVLPAPKVTPEIAEARGVPPYETIHSPPRHSTFSNPSELLGSPRMAVLFEQLTEKYDVVFVDSPPTLMAADAPVIAAQVEEAIVVVDGPKTRTSSLKGTLESLNNSQVHLLGVVLNKLKRGRFAYGYGYGYQYNYYKYYRQEEDGGTSTNGAGPAFKLPLVWARSALSKLPLPKNRS